MNLYGILVFNDTGIPVFNYGYTEDEFPSESSYDSTVMSLITFSENIENFNIIYARIFHDIDNIAIKYKLPRDGGIVYNFNTKTFELYEEDWSINLDVFIDGRNQLLAKTDKFMLIPDLPDDIRNDLINYRQLLRDITSKVNNEWLTIHDIEWPEFPQKLLIQPIEMEEDLEPILGIDIPVD